MLVRHLIKFEVVSTSHPISAVRNVSAPLAVETGPHLLHLSYCLAYTINVPPFLMNVFHIFYHLYMLLIFSITVFIHRFSLLSLPTLEALQRPSATSVQ